MSNLSMLVVSYFPLCPFTQNVEEMTAAFDRSEVEIKGCAWLTNGTSVLPVLLVERAKDIVDHIKAWSDGPVEDRFELVIEETKRYYTLALVPIVSKSIERQRLIYQLNNKFPLPDDTKFTVMFKPLQFVSDVKTTFSQCREKIPQVVDVYLSDVSEMVNGVPGEIHKVGTFDRSKTSEWARNFARDSVKD